MELQPAKKAPAVSVLKCQGHECGGLLAYEIAPDGSLYIDLAWTARRSGTDLYLPCPKCGGKNVLGEFLNERGATRQRVVRWEP